MTENHTQAFYDAVERKIDLATRRSVAAIWLALAAFGLSVVALLDVLAGQP